MIDVSSFPGQGTGSPDKSVHVGGLDGSVVFLFCVPARAEIPYKKTAAASRTVFILFLSNPIVPT